MSKSNILDTSGELQLQRYGNGIKLIAPEAANSIYSNNKKYHVAEILQFPFNVYFLNTESIVQIGNEVHANTMGL